MKPYKWMSVLIVLGLLASACSLLPVENPQPTAQPPQPTTQLPQPTPVPTPLPAVTAARAMLAAQLKIPIEQVEVVKFEKVDWPDGCLGLPKPGEMCIQVMTPGYKVTLQVNQKQYIFRTNLDGTQVVPEQPLLKDLPAAVQMASQNLASKLGISVDAITVMTFETVDWPDGCLGVPQKGVMCTQMITPGYKVTLEANQKQYIYHTNQDGTSMILEPSTNTADLPAAVQMARQALANKLGVTADAITVVSFDAVDWPDSCLGVQQKGVMCLEVVSPGYRVTLSANKQNYEYHTDSTGQTVLPATSITTP
jgi:hypothetical protein